MTAELKRTAMPPEEHGTTDLQKIFENLLNKLKSGSKREIILPGDSLQTSEGEIRQQLFVQRGRSSIPDMGAKMITTAGSIVYCLVFHKQFHPDIGQIWVATNRLEAIPTGREFSVPDEIVGTKGDELATEYDRAIILVAANEVNQPILHSRHAEDGSPLHRTLQSEGYIKRPRYPEILDKFFLPKAFIE